MSIIKKIKEKILSLSDSYLFYKNYYHQNENLQDIYQKFELKLDYAAFESILRKIGKKYEYDDTNIECKSNNKIVKDFNKLKNKGVIFMTRQDISNKLSQVFSDVFDDEIVVTDEMTAADIPEWDSLMHITLISEVEDAFGIKFSMKDVLGMKNVGEMVDVILKSV